MKYILPKPHLSWSAFDLWNKNPDRFRREYFEAGRRLDTKFLQFGKGIAKSIEDGSYKEALPELIVYPAVEYKINVEIRGVPLLSFVDSYDPGTHTFREYKTGKHPWDQSKVQKHGQLLFYAMALRALTGEMPAYCDLDWIETTEKQGENDDFWAKVDKKLSLTGKIVSFHRIFDIREIERMEDEIERAAMQISEAYQKFIKEI